MATQSGTESLTPSTSPQVSHDAGELMASLARARDASEMERLRVAAAHTGHVAVQWNAKSDLLTFSDDAASVLGLSQDGLPRFGQQYRSLMPQQDRERYETQVLETTQLDDGEGIEYDVSYQIVVDPAQEPVMIEERGRLVCGEDGELSDLIAIIRQRKAGGEKVVNTSLVDLETGLATKYALMDALEASLGQGQCTCGLLVASVSNIKDIREIYGPAIVPETVTAAAARLRSVMRGGDMLARVGQAQFGLLLRECTSEQIQVATDRFIAAIRNDVISTEFGPVWVELTAGGVVVPNTGKAPSEIYMLAEDALSKAESIDFNSFEIHDISSQRDSTQEENRRSAQTIISALNDHRFTLWHQPIVRADDKKPAMYESLLRMKTERGEIVPAAHLVPVAEKLGFMQMIDAVVCRSSLELLAEKPGAQISFNLSDSALTDRYCASQILSIIAEAGSVASNICIEVSYRTAMVEATRSMSSLQRFRELGCSVAVSGYLHEGLSAEVLKNADYVKLDGSMCSGISGRTNDVPLIKAAVEFAHRAGAKVIAERIECEQDADILTEAGVDCLQGFLFGKASPDHFNVTLTRELEPLEPLGAGSACAPARREPAPDQTGAQSSPPDTARPEDAAEPVEAQQTSTASPTPAVSPVMPIIEMKDLTAREPHARVEPAAAKQPTPAAKPVANKVAGDDADMNLLKSALSKLDEI